MSTNSAHKAIILLTIEVHDILPSGECSGQPVPQNTLKEHGLKRNMTVTVDGFDMDDCLKKLKERINEFGRK